MYALNVEFLCCMIQAHIIFSLVNRAARVAAQCEPGQICVGIPLDANEEPPDPRPTVEIEVIGVKQLKGISTEMAIFACRKVKDQTEEAEDQMKKSDASRSKGKHSEEKALPRKPRKKNTSSLEEKKIVSDKPENDKRPDKLRRSSKKDQIDQPAAQPSSDTNSLAMW